MRSESEVESFKAEASEKVRDCPKCDGSMYAATCECVSRYFFEIAAYEACIPRDFWDTMSSSITANTEAFQKYIKKYVTRINTAHRSGYGLVLTGSNGVGKSTFVCYIGANAIRKGKSVYYTTLPQLDHDLKLGFDDFEIKKRMDVMLTSDFLILDEMNKEFLKDVDKPTWLKTQIERILKNRFDEKLPVLMATNATKSQLVITYGPTVASMLSGKYQVIPMEPGDVRKNLSKKMQKDMSF